MQLRDWADVATIISSIGVLAAVGALLFGWKQLKHSVKETKHSAENSKAQFWLDLRKMFRYHIEIHSKLRRGSDYAKRQSRPECCNQNESWPCCNDEWVKVEAYMGLFEHCEGLLEDKLIDEKTFSDIYKYRVVNIIANKKIESQKLVEEGKDWRRFRALARRFGLELRPCKEEKAG